MRTWNLVMRSSSQTPVSIRVSPPIRSSCRTVAFRFYAGIPIIVRSGYCLGKHTPKAAALFDQAAIAR
jgi:hypothetical protein